MKLYFSGLAGRWEASVLEEAGITRVLVDPFDLKNAGAFPVIGDPEASRAAWLEDTSKIPVWHWGESMKLLRWYLDQTDGIVGIGGCVNLMRKRSGALWHGLYKICQQHPGRFHVFEANWLALLERIAPYVSSADTSKWIDGARYGEVIGHDLQPVKSELDRKERCRVYAQAMNEVFNPDLFEKENEDPGQLHQNFLMAMSA